MADKNQVLLTVLGLRARGHRAALVAHPEGELRRRAAEGTDLYLLAPRMEMDLAAAWSLSRLLRDLQPEVVHAHDAHAVAMTALALSLGSTKLTTTFVVARRVDFHIGKNALSRWKYRQVDCFICASSAIQSMLVDDGIPADRTTVVYEASISGTSWRPRRSMCTRSSGCRMGHRSSATLRRSCRTKASDT